MNRKILLIISLIVIFLVGTTYFFIKWRARTAMEKFYGMNYEDITKYRHAREMIEPILVSKDKDFTKVNRTTEVQFDYWENFSQKYQLGILNDSKVLKYAINFYNDKYDFNKDDHLLFQLLDTISKGKNENLFPFYYYLFSKICSVSDGYVSEALGSHCIELLLNHTEYIINHFRVGQNDKKEMTYFVDFISFEFYANSTTARPWQPSFDKFSTELKLKVENKENKKLLDTFLKTIETNTDKMIKADRK